MRRGDDDRWLCAVIVAMTGCGRVGFDTVVVVPGEDATNALRPLCTTPFEPPTVILEIASPYSEFSPEITDDGLEIFWHDNEPAGLGGDDLWTAVRASTAEVFGARSLVANVNSPVNDGGVSLSFDGLELYFSSERFAGGQGEIFVARRTSRVAAFGSAQRIVEVSSSGYEAGPSLSPDGLTVYFTSDRSGTLGRSDIWFATRATTTSLFDPPQNLTVLNSPASEGSPSITANGLSLFYEVTAIPLEADVWVSTRASTADPFSPGTRVDELSLVNSTDFAPSISASGERITFSSDRRATMDAFIATRVCP